MHFRRFKSDRQLFGIAGWSRGAGIVLGQVDGCTVDTCHDAKPQTIAGLAADTLISLEFDQAGIML